jgi:dimethylargininase
MALTREVSPSIARCELTHLDRDSGQPIDVALAQSQHALYLECLARLGCTVIGLGAEPDLPDSVFVEDIVIVLDEVAIITRPGAKSRRPERSTIRRALSKYRELRSIDSPGKIDGGDVLRIGRTLYVGRSTRSNREGIEQLRTHVTPYGYSVEPVETRGCLHLKSAITLVADDTLLVNRDWLDVRPFGGLRFIDVDPAEPFGANALLVNGSVIYPAEFERTRQRLEAEGIVVHAVPAGELAKAEGGVTCCSVVFED